MTAPALVYVRPWNTTQFKQLADGIWPNGTHVAFSEHRGIDEAGLHEAMNRIYRRQETAAATHLSEQETSDVIWRCRLLRALPEEQAARLVLAAETAIEQCLDRHQPHTVFSTSVDTYILHLMVLACWRRDIPFIGLIPSFLNGHFRVTALGENQKVRDVSDAEVLSVLDGLLETQYKPDFIAKSADDIRQLARQRWQRNLIKPLWFGLKRRLTGDPLNYHDWSTEIVSRQYWSLRQQDYDGSEAIERSDLPAHLRDRRILFLPLQMSPEATIDYWSTDPDWVDYETKVLSVIDRYTEDHVFLVKEHPSVLGYRAAGFYKRLAERSNVVMVAPRVASNTIMDICNAVVICTGTVGFEAAIRGVPVYCDSNPYYLPHDIGQPLSALSEPCPPKATSNQQQHALMRNVLEGVLPGHFLNNGTWQADKHDQSTMIASLRTMIGQGWTCR